MTAQNIYYVPREWQMEMYLNPSKYVQEMMSDEDWYQMVMFELFEPGHNDFPKYGTEEFKELMLEKHGVEHQMHLDWVKEKIVHTLNKKYGVTNAFQIDQKEKVLTKYGVENVMQVESVKQTHKETLLKRHGVANSFQINQKEIMLEKHGVENPMHLDWVKQKQKQTLIKKHGVENVSQLPEVREKKRQKEKEKQQRPLVLELRKIQKQHGIKYGSGWSQKRDEDLVKLYENVLLHIKEGTHYE